MAMYYGGQTVTEGFYLNQSKLGFECIESSGGALPGERNTCYRRLPLPAVMVAGPVMGLVYVVTLPFVACFTFIYYSVRWLARRSKLQSRRVAA